MTARLLRSGAPASRARAGLVLVHGRGGSGAEIAPLADALGLRMIEWNVKSTTRAQQGLYEYDAVSRLRDSQLGEERVHDVKNYIKKGKLWETRYRPYRSRRSSDRRDR